MQPTWSRPARMVAAVAPGTALSVSDRGLRGDDALVLLHGWGASALWWEPVAEDLGADHRVIVPDLRMHGQSLALSPDAPISIRALTEDVFAVLDVLGVDRAVLVGHSMGGQIATLAADLHPERIVGTVVADPAYGAGDDEIAEAPQRRAQFLASARARCQVPGGPTQDAEAESRHLAALAELYDSQYLRPDSVGAARDTAVLLRRRTRPALTVYSSEAAAVVELELSGSGTVRPEVVVWPGVSHEFPIQRPKTFSDLVRGWVRRIAAGPCSPESTP